MKKLLSIAVILVICFIVLGIVKNPLIKSVVTASASKVVGAPVEIGGFSLGIFKQAVRIKDFTMYNPEGFPEGILIDIPEISVDYNLGALLKRKLHLPRVSVNLKEVSLIKNKDGELNVDALKVSQDQEESTPAPEDKKPSRQMAMQIDELTLTIGKLVFKDYSVGEKPSIQAYEVGIKEKTYKDITSAQQLTVLILSEPMKGAGIKGAGIYGAATILGLGFLPAGVAGVLTGKDSSQAEFNISYDKVYNTSLDVLKQMGAVTAEDKSAGIIKGKVSGSSIKIKIEKKDKKTVQVTASARKFLMPKPEVAGGVIYQISEELK